MMYKLPEVKYSPKVTQELIMKYDPLYYSDEYFQMLWIESFKTKKYLPQRDEGLAGLTEEVKSFEEMRKELLIMIGIV